MALDLAPGGGSLNASALTSIRLSVSGNGEFYGLHLRAVDVARPWQSYRAHFEAPESWREVRLSFVEFSPHRIDAPLDLTRLRRLGPVAIGRAFHADLRLAEIAFYR